MMDFRLKVAAVCCHNYAKTDKVKAVTAILKHHGYDYTLMVDPLWSGYISKIWHMMDVAKNLTGYTHLMFIDAADVVALAGQDEIMGRYFEFGHPWVYNAEPSIWTPGSFTPEEYPTPNVLYRYFNAGASIGEIGHMFEWLDTWGRPARLVDGDQGDQDWMAARFIESYPGAIELDTNCDLFQCMCGSQIEPDPHVTVRTGAVHNNVTGTDPLVIHFNGGTNIYDPDRRYLWEHFLQKPQPG